MRYERHEGIEERHAKAADRSRCKLESKMNLEVRQYVRAFEAFITNFPRQRRDAIGQQATSQ
jgi:hypothetical protein